MVHCGLFDQKSLRGEDYVDLFTRLPRKCEKQSEGMRSDDTTLLGFAGPSTAAV